MPALYRKYRSGSFQEVVGQPQVTDILEASLKQGKISHGYLLVGPRGVGKTSVARILAHAINGLEYSIEKSHIDIIEIDAASNTGVDNIRDLIDKAQIAPSLAPKKIYIIDEVHMLSKSAFNAFLKLLEEPPAHVVFILATTDEHKIPATVVSRTQKFVFRKIPTKTIAEHLAKIAKKEKIKIADDSLYAIAESSDGGMRDAINLFDQISSLADKKKTVDESIIRDLLGLVPKEDLQKIITDYLSGDAKSIHAQLLHLLDQNFDTSDIARQLLNLSRRQLIERPELINLIEQLLVVGRSSQPELALLVACTHQITPNKTSPPKSTTKSAKKPKSAQTVVKSTPTEKEPKTTAKVAAKDKSVKPVKKNKPSSFDSQKLLDECKSNHLAMFSLLSKAKFQVQDQNLNIAMPNNFSLKRLSSSKYQVELNQALEAIGFGFLNININLDQQIAEQKEAVDQIITIMGGGEEVNVPTKSW